MKILNFVLDEKFIDGMIESHDMMEGAIHSYACIIDNPANESAFTRVKRHPDRVSFLESSSLITSLMESDVDAVFLHSLESFPIDLIPHIPKHIKVFWFAWGFDIYMLPEYKPFIDIPLYEKRTRKIISESWFATLKKRIKSLGYLTGISCHPYYKALSRIDYFSGVLPYEYDLMLSVPGFHAKKVQYRYMSRHGLTTSCEFTKPTGNNIIVGNSAAPANNHLDVLDYLQKITSHRNIYVPLSYGNVGTYSDKVKEGYTRILGQKFVPLEEFMPRNEFHNLFKSCSIAIYYHLRQQAIGNIRIALQNGCKVFMNENNQAYQYLKSIGLHVFSLQHDFSESSISMSLTQKEIEDNIAIMNKLNSLDYYKMLISGIYSELEQRKKQ